MSRAHMGLRGEGFRAHTLLQRTQVQFLAPMSGSLYLHLQSDVLPLALMGNDPHLHIPTNRPRQVYEIKNNRSKY